MSRLQKHQFKGLIVVLVVAGALSLPASAQAEVQVNRVPATNCGGFFEFHVRHKPGTPAPPAKSTMQILSNRKKLIAKKTVYASGNGPHYFRCYYHHRCGRHYFISYLNVFSGYETYQLRVWVKRYAGD